MEKMDQHQFILTLADNMLNSTNPDIALKAAEIIILDQIRTTLHKMFKYGLDVNNNT